jgi:hypothetical protein
VLHRKPVHFGQRSRRAEKKSSYGLVAFHAFSKCLERTLSCPIAWLLGVFLQCSHPLTRSNDAVPGIRGWQVLKYPLFQRYRLPWISPLCTSVARDWHGALRHVQRCCSRLLVRFLSRGFASATPTRMRTVSQSRARGCRGIHRDVHSHQVSIKHATHQKPGLWISAAEARRHQHIAFTQTPTAHSALVENVAHDDVVDLLPTALPGTCFPRLELPKRCCRDAELSESRLLTPAYQRSRDIVSFLHCRH